MQLSWDILADLARVKPGDWILLHASGSLSGIFQVTRKPSTAESDADLYDGANITTANWGANDSDERLKTTDTYRWWFSFTPVEDLFFPEELPMSNVFELIAAGRLHSLPQRLRYEDKNKVTKGVSPEDFSLLNALLFNSN